MAIALELRRRSAHVDVAGILVLKGPAVLSGDGTIDDAAMPTEIEAS
jgi:hypothetical protein